RDVPDLMLPAAEGTQQVHLALVPLRQLGAVAHSRHLGAAGLGEPRLPGDVRQVLRVLRIRHVDDRGAVVLLLARQRVEHVVAVVADVRDPAIALLVNRGLIGAASLQIAIADELEVLLLGLVVLRLRAERDDRERENELRLPHSSLLLVDYFLRLAVRLRGALACAAFRGTYPIASTSRPQSSGVRAAWMRVRAGKASRLLK